MDFGYNLGVSYVNNEEYKKAKEVLLEYSEHNECGYVFNLLGNICARYKNYEDAEKFYLRSIELKYSLSMVNLGTLYRDLGFYKKAEEIFLNAINLKIDEITLCYYNLGLVYLKNKEKNEENKEKMEELEEKAVKYFKLYLEKEKNIPKSIKETLNNFIHYKNKKNSYCVIC